MSQELLVNLENGDDFHVTATKTTKDFHKLLTITNPTEIELSEILINDTPPINPQKNTPFLREQRMTSTSSFSSNSSSSDESQIEDRSPTRITFSDLQFRPDNDNLSTSSLDTPLLNDGTLTPSKSRRFAP